MNEPMVYVVVVHDKLFRRFEVMGVFTDPKKAQRIYELNLGTVMTEVRLIPCTPDEFTPSRLVIEGEGS